MADVVLHDLVIREEDGDHVIGRVATGVFVTVPPVGVRVVELLREGLSAAETRGRIAAEGTDVDVDAFITDLRDCGFVIDPDTATPPRPHLPRLRGHHVRWLFSRPAAAVWLTVVLAAAVTLVARPDLLPAGADFFWLPGTSLPLIGATAIACLTITLHELAHLAAARAVDVPARISLSTRLYHLVAQTDVSAVWAVPRRRRYVVYLAGIGSDLAVGALAVLLLAYADLPGPVEAGLRMVVLTVTLGVAWQFEVYLRTDLYFVLLDRLRCRDLHADACRYLRRRSTGLSPDEARRVRWYAWFMVAGTVIALGMFAVYTAPILVQLWTRAATTAWHGLTTPAALPLLDGVATLLHQALLAGLFLVGLRNRRRNRQRA